MSEMKLPEVRTDRQT